MVSAPQTSLTKTIHSRSNKNIGDIIEERWEITGKTVIAEPQPGDPRRGVPPRFGIYEYAVKAIPMQAPATSASGGKRKPKEPSVGGTRREASTVPLTVRRLS
jgi:hypothetical protein